MDKPNYYAIIPAEVRYSDIKPNAKLLYGEITALTNKKGYCFANNNYFAELYNVSKNTISLWIKELNESGFIQVEMIYKNKQVIERRIGITIFSGGAIPKKMEDNNTRVNTTRLLNIREMKFGSEVSEISSELQMSIESANEFLKYWTEQNHSKTKMKFELERTFDIKRRLERWKKNNEKWNKTSSNSRVKQIVNSQQKAREMIEKMNNNTNM